MFEEDRKNKISKEVRYVSVSFYDLLALAFIVLKLCGVISWSWLWVLAPIWMPIALALGLVIIVIIIYGILYILS